MNLDSAIDIARTARAEARRLELQPVTVAVLDAHGVVVVLHREDRSGLLRPDIAIGKAWGALGLGISSRAAAVIAAERPVVAQAFSTLAGGRFVPTPGGVLAYINDELVGAVGVSGASPDDDEACAIAGISSVGWRADV